MDMNGIIANLFSTFSVYISYHGYLPSQVDFFVSGSGRPNSDFRFLFENMKKHALGAPCSRHWKWWCVQTKKGKVGFGILGREERGKWGLALVGVGRSCPWELGEELNCTVTENRVITSLDKFMRRTRAIIVFFSNQGQVDLSHLGYSCDISHPPFHFPIPFLVLLLALRWPVPLWASSHLHSQQLLLSHFLSLSSPMGFHSAYLALLLYSLLTLKHRPIPLTIPANLVYCIVHSLWHIVDTQSIFLK